MWGGRRARANVADDEQPRLRFSRQLLALLDLLFAPPIIIAPPAAHLKKVWLGVSAAEWTGRRDVGQTVRKRRLHFSGLLTLHALCLGV